MKKTKLIGLLLSVGCLLGSGCDNPKPRNGVYNGYVGEAREGNSFSDTRYIMLFSKTKDRGYIIGRDTFDGSVQLNTGAKYDSNDGRFDTIGINIIKGDPLEKYANLFSLEEAYRTIMDSTESLNAEWEVSK